MYTMDDIRRDGDPVLRKAADPVSLPPTNEEKQVLKQLLEYLKNSQDDETAEKYSLRPGIGLAAPQIGVSKRMIAIYLTDERDHLHEYMLINPKVMSHSVEKTYLESGEGCLSVDRDIPGYVPRYKRVKVKAFNIDGEPVTLKLRDIAAIAVQHEIDHLDGIMFYDRIDKDDPFKVPEGVPEK